MKEIRDFELDVQSVNLSMGYLAMCHETLKKRKEKVYTFIYLFTWNVNLRHDLESEDRTTY